MGFNLDKLHISHSLENHPVLGETLKYKVKYLNVLEYFTLKYSPDDRFSLAMLENYKKAFLHQDLKVYSYSSEELKQVVKGVIGTKFKGFKLFTYRYSLLCDCLLLNAFNDEKKAKIITSEIKGIYNDRYHLKLDQIMSTMFEDEDHVDGIKLIKYQIDCWKKNCENLSKPMNKVLITATMSAGKSTLINGLIGKTINKTMNDACTAKLHHILDKSYEDNFIYELDYDLNLDASYEILMHDNHLNKDDEVFVSTYFRTVGEKSNRLCIVDTPGVNSSLNEDHGLITKKGVLEQNYNKLIYIVNAENTGTNR